MAISKNHWSIVPLEYDVFFGLDVDKKSIAITVVDHKQIIKSFKMPNNPEILINYTKRHFTGKRVAFVYEVGPTGYGLYDHLREAGYDCLVASPSMVPTPRGSRVKTNRIDSLHLATSLRGGQIKSIRVPLRKYRDLRHLTQLYKTTTMQSGRYKCRIKALLLTEGICFPNTSKNDHWSNATIRRLEELECTPTIHFKLHTLLEHLSFYRKQLSRIKRSLHSFCYSDADLADSIRFLLSLPGIGWIIATVLLARIGDWRDLKNVRELAGFIGLTPCERSTGDDVNKGTITRTGNAYLRNILIEGAWAAVRKDPELAEFYQRIYNRHPKDRAGRKAIVAVARKLTTRIYAVLTQRRIYTPVYKEYTIAVRMSEKKRRLNAPKDDSTLDRTAQRVIKRTVKGSPALAGSLTR